MVWLFMSALRAASKVVVLLFYSAFDLSRPGMVELGAYAEWLKNNREASRKLVQWVKWAISRVGIFLDDMIVV